jgi:hypothetical protein
MARRIGRALSTGTDPKSRATLVSNERLSSKHPRGRLEIRRLTSPLFPCFLPLPARLKIPGICLTTGLAGPLRQAADLFVVEALLVHLHDLSSCRKISPRPFERRKSNQRHFRMYPCSVIAVPMPRGTSTKGRKLWGATVPPTTAPITASSKKNSLTPKGIWDDGSGVEPANAPTTTAQIAANGLAALESECSNSQLATGYNVRTSRKSNQGLACHRRLESARDSSAPTTSPATT